MDDFVISRLTVGDELGAVYANRRAHGIYSDALWTEQDHQLERAMDERADHITVVAGDLLVSGLRLTSRARTPFVCERFFRLSEMADALHTRVERLSLMDRLWVVPEHRGRGHGLRMSTAALEFARQHDATHVLVAIDSGFDAPRRIVEELGFRMVSETRLDDGRLFGNWACRL